MTRKSVEDPVFGAILARRFVSIVGPRQVGKTSLLQKAQAVVENSHGYAAAIVDLSAINDQSLTVQQWSEIFCERLQLQLRPFLEGGAELLPPRNPARFQEYWSRLGSSVRSSSIVILLDEANAIPESIKDVFYSNIRSIYTEQRSYRGDPALAKLRFVFAGVFDPQKLVKDRRNSPFNVSEVIRVVDFSLQEVQDLFAGLYARSMRQRGTGERRWNTLIDRVLKKHDAGDPHAVLSRLSRLAFESVSGHPYLTQEFSSIMVRQLERTPATLRDLDKVATPSNVELLHRAGDSIAQVLRFIELSPEGEAAAHKEIIRKLLDGERIAFNRMRSSMAALELAGAIKEGPLGNCVFRNHLFESVFRSVMDEQSGSPEHNGAQTPPIRGKNVFVSYSHLDEKYVRDLRPYLKPLERRHDIVIWDDTKLQPGQRWRESIRKAISDAGVAVLLVSQNFIASDFVDKSELPEILNSARSGGLKILWVPIRRSTYRDTPIEEYQAVGDPARPLETMQEDERSSALLEVYEAVKKALELP